MHCEYCGNYVDDSEETCPSCGARLDRQEEQPPEDTSPPQEYEIYTSPPQEYERYAPSPGRIKSYLGWAILSTLFFCPPIGIIGIVLAVQVKKHLKAGDDEEARKTSRAAKVITWITFIAGIVMWLYYWISPE